MEPFIVHVQPELSEFGATLTRAGTLEQAEYHVGGQRLSTPQGVEYDLVLTNTGEGILLSGIARAEAQGICARCLKPVSVSIQGEVEGYYLLQQADELDGYARDEFECVDEEGCIDIAAPIEAALVYDTPFVLLCGDECKGLCPKCGADLNEGPCDCDDEDDIDPDNPFTVLKNITFDDGE